MSDGTRTSISLVFPLLRLKPLEYFIHCPVNYEVLRLTVLVILWGNPTYERVNPGAIAQSFIFSVSCYISEFISLCVVNTTGYQIRECIFSCSPSRDWIFHIISLETEGTLFKKLTLTEWYHRIYRTHSNFASGLINVLFSTVIHLRLYFISSCIFIFSVWNNISVLFDFHDLDFRNLERS